MEADGAGEVAPEVVGREVLLRASRFEVQRVVQRLSDGALFEREVVVHPGAVAIVPVMHDGRICLIRNFRAAVCDYVLELPAGTCESGEPVEVTARRELLEETGYRCAELASFGTLLMSPGILCQQVHLFVASGLELVGQQLEVGEMIEVLSFSLTELDGMLAEGRIQDAKTVAALMRYLRYRA